MKDRIVGITEARANFANLIAEADEQPVYVLKNGRPVGVILSAAKYEALLDRLEDAEDALSVHNADPEQSIPFTAGSPRRVPA